MPPWFQEALSWYERGNRIGHGGAKGLGGLDALALAGVDEDQRKM